jgi:hypothetical protein
MVNQIDWFVSDFTLPEVKKLRASRHSKSPQQYNNQYAIVTFEEVVFWQN